MTTISSIANAYAEQYRLRDEGSRTGLAEAMQANPDIVRPLSPEEMAAMRAMETPSAPAEARPERIYGQVLVHGKVFATVFESGIALMDRDVPGLSGGGAGTGLAQARLREIAQAVGGEVRRNAFLAAEEIYRQMGWDAMRAQFKT